MSHGLRMVFPATIAILALLDPSGPGETCPSPAASARTVTSGLSSARRTWLSTEPTARGLLSDNGSTLGNFSITQYDPDYPGDSLTVSASVVPEPPSLVLLSLGSFLGLAILAWRRAQLRPGPGPSRSPSSIGRCSSN